MMRISMRLVWFIVLAAAVVFVVTGSAVAADAAKADAEMKPYTVKVHEDGVTFDMVPIPGGVAKVGSPEDEEDRDDDEGPQFEVEIEPFWMGAREVTWAEWEQFQGVYGEIQDTGGAPPIPEDRQADAVSIPTPIWEQDAGPILEDMGRGGKYPAILMSQTAAKQYCKWLSKKTGHFYRLPTEAEWEYAARAGTTTPYYFGDDMDELEKHAIFFDNSLNDNDIEAYVHVGTHAKPNAWGLYDMHGNVAEWVMDAYVEDHFKQFEGKKVSWKDAIAWPKERYPRVFKGGGCLSDPEDCRVAARKHTTRNFNKQDPQIPQSPWYITEGFGIGFRLVRPLKEPSEEEKLKFWEPDTPDIIDVIEAKRDRGVKILVEAVKPAE